MKLCRIMEWTAIMEKTSSILGFILLKIADWTGSHFRVFILDIITSDE